MLSYTSKTVQSNTIAASPSGTRTTFVGTWWANRFWWLPGARTAEIASSVREVFAHREIKRIVPAHGAILEGPEVVSEHVEFVCSLLDEFSQERPTPPPSNQPAVITASKQAVPTRPGPGLAPRHWPPAA